MLEAVHDRQDIILLSPHRRSIQVRIWRRRVSPTRSASSHFTRMRRKGEECKVDRNMMTLCRRKIRFKVAQEALVHCARQRLHELCIRHPNTCPHKRHAVALHVRKVVLPHQRIARPGEIPAIFLRRKVVRAHRQKRLAAQCQKVFVHSKCRSRVQRSSILHLQSILIELYGASVFRVSPTHFIKAIRQHLRQRNSRRCTPTLQRDAGALNCLSRIIDQFNIRISCRLILQSWPL